MSQTISVFLTTAQKNKLNSGKTFQLSAVQLQAGSGKHAVDIEMTSKNYKTLIKNVGKNKGYRFTSDKIVGSGFFKDVGKLVAKKVAPKILDKIGEKTGQSGLTNALKGSVDGLVDLGADRVTGGKLKKGSIEMKEHMARIRSMRKGKGVSNEVVGDGILEDLGRKIKRGWNKTFNLKLGREIKGALTSDIAKDVYKGIANVGLSAASTLAGVPALGRVGNELVNSAIDGPGVKHRKNTMVKGGTLVGGVPCVQIRGAGFTGTSGTKYSHGGSYKSPTSGGSFKSA